MTRVALAALSIPLLGGCGYLHAMINPIDVAARRNIKPGFAEPDRQPGWPLEAKSSRKSHISGRNNLAVKAVIGHHSADRLEILVLMTSTEKHNVDPRRFYVHVDAGDGWREVTEIEVGAVENRPYRYGVSVPVLVDAGMLRYSDGSTARLKVTRRVTQTRSEDYFTRSAKLVFRGDPILPRRARELSVRLRDLGVNIRMTWNLNGGPL